MYIKRTHRSHSIYKDKSQMEWRGRLWGTRKTIFNKPQKYYWKVKNQLEWGVTNKNNAAH